MDFCCCFCKQPRLIPELADSYPDFDVPNEKKRSTLYGEPRVTKTQFPQSRPHSRKSSRPIIYGKFHELPLLRLEDQPLSSCSGLIIVQKLFRRPNTRSHWRRRIRYLQVTPNLWTRQDRSSRLKVCDHRSVVSVNRGLRSSYSSHKIPYKKRNRDKVEPRDSQCPS